MDSRPHHQQAAPPFPAHPFPTHPPLRRSRPPLSTMNLPAAVAALRLPPPLPHAPDHALLQPSPLSPPTPPVATSPPPPTPPTPATPATPATPSGSDAKRAQNRKSAKRFRDAQKQRWAALNAQVLAQAAELRELRAAAAAHAAAAAPHPPHDHGVGNTTDGSGAQPCAPNRANAISIDALTAPPPSPPPPPPPTPPSPAEAEARLYSRILASPALTPSPTPGATVYAAELGTLVRCVCTRTGAVLRGDPLPPGGLYAGMQPGSRTALAGALAGHRTSPIAISYARANHQLNAVVGVDPNGMPDIVAEFEYVAC